MREERRETYPVFDDQSLEISKTTKSLKGPNRCTDGGSRGNSYLQENMENIIKRSKQAANTYSKRNEYDETSVRHQMYTTARQSQERDRDELKLTDNKNIFTDDQSSELPRRSSNNAATNSILMAQIQANDLHLQKLHDINKVAEKDRKTFNQKYTDFGENIHPTTGHLDSAYYNNHKRLAPPSNESQPKTGEFFGTEKTWQQKSNILTTSPYLNKKSSQEEETFYNKKSTEEEMFIGKFFSPLKNFFFPHKKKDFFPQKKLFPYTNSF
jgi:hypothetical protein